jgi:hypothetical protein
MTVTLWNITNIASGVSTKVDGTLGPAFMIKVKENGQEVTYVTVLVKKLDGDPLDWPRQFYENQLTPLREPGDPDSGIVYAINTVHEKDQPGDVNVVNIDRS